MTPFSNVQADYTPNYISSKDAYMLIYARRQSESVGTGYDQLPEPPPQARERVADLNKLHGVECASYMERLANPHSCMA